VTRLRRLRRSDRLRSLVREIRLDLDDFVLPFFVGPATEPNPDLPALARYSVEDLVADAA
jgi:delta-aminolevulinic acid dehydratase/porphobilinogen synthase